MIKVAFIGHLTRYEKILVFSSVNKKQNINSI